MNSKYNVSETTSSTEDAEQAAKTKIKKDILINWGLQPPNMQALRPISDLLCSIQTVFPPAFDVPAHDYFKKWKPVNSADLTLNSNVMGNSLDEAKIKKAVKKLRFFLHPDKLPKDLTSEQQFMVKMLWDITNDASEEFNKKNEELDWIKG